MKDTPADAANFHAVALGYVASQLEVDRDEARRIVRKMHEAVWMDAPVIKFSPGTLPESEDGIHKYHCYME